MPEIVLPLADPGGDLARVGGKGASLARLAGAGLPVPPGFHVTTDAYRDFVHRNGLQDQILEAADGAAGQIGELFAQHDMSEATAESVPPTPSPPHSTTVHVRHSIGRHQPKR